jgi:membrane protein
MGRLVDFGTTIAGVAYECDVKYPAAALAYYAFVSFIPVLLLAFALLGERFAGQIHGVTPRFLTLEAQTLVYRAMTEASGRTGASLLAVGVIAWSGANVAVTVLTVVERVEHASERPLGEQLRDSAAVLGSLCLAIGLIVLVSTVTARLPAGAVLGALVLPVALAGAFLPLLYVPSRIVTSASTALPGAITVGVGWTIIHYAVQFYILNAGRYAIYGALSGVIVILTSLYLAAVVLLTGVIVNATLAGDRVPR